MLLAGADLDSGQLVRVEDEVYLGDTVIDHGESDDRNDSGPDAHDDTCGAVDECWLAILCESRSLYGRLRGDVVCPHEQRLGRSHRA